MSLILPSQRIEPYVDVAAHIKAPLDFLQTTGQDKPKNVSLAANYGITVRRLRARWQGPLSKQEHPAANRKLSEEQEGAVGQYLDRVDTVGTRVRLQMVSRCSNSILKKPILADCRHLSLVISDHSVSSITIPSMISPTNAVSILIASMPINLIIYVPCWKSRKLFAISMVFQKAIYRTLTRQDFEYV